MQTQLLPVRDLSSKDAVITATLPIAMENGSFLDAGMAREFGSNLSGHYVNGHPFARIIIDEFLPLALTEALLENFPADVEKKKDAFWAALLNTKSARFSSMTAMAKYVRFLPF